MQDLGTANDGPLAQVREGMRVVDAADQDVGRVDIVAFGDAEATTAQGDERPHDLIHAAAEAFAPGEREPDVPEPLRSRLVRGGYIKIDGPGVLDTDRYVPADQVGGVSNDRVYLRVRKEQLAKEE
jgi:hypothetical protein